mgnify:CR=1 FL=1
MPLHILPVDYSQTHDRQALVMLLDTYARDPMGGGEGLAQEVKDRLCDDLAKRPMAASFIAWLNGAPVGLINCIEGYSTFKAQPLMNIHDIVVLPGHRGAGVGQALLAAAEACGYRHVGWADASFLGDELPSDKYPNERLLQQALARIQPGDILMAHLGIWSRQDPWAPAVLEPLIEGLKARGLCFATLREHPAYRDWVQAHPLALH